MVENGCRKTEQQSHETYHYQWPHPLRISTNVREESQEHTYHEQDTDEGGHLEGDVREEVLFLLLLLSK